MDRVASSHQAPALYPPTITPPDQPLPLWRLLPAFVANPLLVLPRAVYEQDMLAGVRPGSTCR
jgi:hypothetical protein